MINFSEDKKQWRSVLDNKKIYWSGNFLGPKEPSRSIPLKNFENLLKLNFNFYYFQNEIRDRDKEFLKKIKITDYSKEKFADIIAIIQNLDLMISTDTFFLHLACICNKKTWGLISANSDWRWFKYYKYNPYESLKIFKQTNYKNWDNVIDLLQKNLKDEFLI